jgi:hypothetical protein
MGKEHLLKVSAFYKNNTPDGIGMIIENTNFDLGKRISDFANSYEKAWESADEEEREKFVDGYFDQLNHFAKFRAQDRTQGENFICVINIWFLEKYGFLKSDNFNGCTFLYGNNPF